MEPLSYVEQYIPTPNAHIPVVSIVDFAGGEACVTINIVPFCPRHRNHHNHQNHQQRQRSEQPHYVYARYVARCRLIKNAKANVCTANWCEPNVRINDARWRTLRVQIDGKRDGECAAERVRATKTKRPAKMLTKHTQKRIKFTAISLQCFGGGNRRLIFQPLAYTLLFYFGNFIEWRKYNISYHWALNLNKLYSQYDTKSLLWNNNFGRKM